MGEHIYKGRKLELLIPASSLEVLKIAVIYGADAVYIGGEAFGLRAKAKNFTLEEMKEGIEFAHAHDCKVYVTANILAHNYDLDGARQYFKELKQIGFTTCLISNNKEPRVKSFCDKVDSDYIFKAGKPLPGGYEEGIRKMKTTKENTLFIGDQIFTDVLGAKRAGLYTIMVKPIHPKEEIQIVLKRYLERIVLFFYFRSIRKKSVEK